MILSCLELLGVLNRLRLIFPPFWSFRSCGQFRLSSLIPPTGIGGIPLLFQPRVSGSVKENSSRHFSLCGRGTVAHPPYAQLHNHCITDLLIRHDSGIQAIPEASWAFNITGLWGEEETEMTLTKMYEQQAEME